MIVRELVLVQCKLTQSQPTGGLLPNDNSLHLLINDAPEEVNAPKPNLLVVGRVVLAPRDLGPLLALLTHESSLAEALFGWECGALDVDALAVVVAVAIGVAVVLVLALITEVELVTVATAAAGATMARTGTHIGLDGREK